MRSTNLKIKHLPHTATTGDAEIDLAAQTDGIAGGTPRGDAGGYMSYFPVQPSNEHEYTGIYQSTAGGTPRGDTNSCLDCDSRR